MRVWCVRCRDRPLPPYGVPLPCLHSVRTASPQPCFPLRRACRRVRPHRSTIGRLPSGASASLRHRSAQRPLGCRGRCGARLARARWRLWTARHSATADSAFPRDAQSIRECALHGLVGIPPCALQRRLAASCASRRRIRSGPVVSAAPSRPRYSQDVGASVAACTSRSAPHLRFALHWHDRSALRPTRPTRLTHDAPSERLAQPWHPLAAMSLLGAERGVEAAARGGASADGGTRKTPRLRLRGATGGIPTKRPAAQARLDCAPYGGCARGSRRCAAKAPPEAQR